MQDLSEKSSPAAAAATNAPVEVENAMFCTDCGTRNPDDARFCKQCGHRTAKGAAPKISEEEFALPESADEKVRRLLLRAYERYEARDLAAAVAVTREALELRPDSTDAHSLLSTLYEKQGERELAIAERETVLRLNPGSIADREKLDELKDGKPSGAVPRIHVNHRSTPPGVFDTPGGQAAVAVGVMAVVLVLGFIGIWVSRPKAAEAKGTGTLDARGGAQVSTPFSAPAGMSASGSAPRQLAQNTPNTQNTQSAPSGQNYAGPAAQPRNGAGVIYRNDQYPQPAAMTQNGARTLPPLNNAGPIGPAPVNPPRQGGIAALNTRPAQNDGGYDQPGASSRGGTVHLTDTTGSQVPVANAGAPSAVTSNASTPNSAQTNPPRPNTGRIEIIVSPGPPTGSSGTTGNSGSVNAGNNSAGPGVSGGTFDSVSHRRAAQDAQSRGDYRKALASYLRALDGAGDDAGAIHQQMGLCYQRLDDGANAVNHYREAIKVYRAQVAAGRNVEAANRGIAACETGIKVVQ
jgi:tetratricopeptide (TPR) repeat protein